MSPQGTKSSSAQTPSLDTASAVLFRFRLPFGTSLALLRQASSPNQTSEGSHLGRVLADWLATHVWQRIAGRARQSPLHLAASRLEQLASSQGTAAPRKETAPPAAMIQGVESSCDAAIPTETKLLVNTPDKRDSFNANQK